MLNPNGTYAGSSIKNISNGKREMTPTQGISFGIFISKRKPFATCSSFKK
jgi:hypothetical protein